MLQVRVCAAPIGGFLDPNLRVPFRQILLTHGWVVKKLVKNGKNWAVFRQNSS